MKKFIFLNKGPDMVRWYILVNPRDTTGKTEGLNLAGRVLDYQDKVLAKIPEGTVECYFQSAQWHVHEYDTQEELVWDHLEDIL